MTGKILCRLKRKTKMQTSAKPSVGVLILKGNKVLLVKNTLASSHASEIYGLPSGKVDPGETEKQSAVRELKEETGLICAEKDLVEFPGNYHVSRIKYKDGKNNLWGWRVFLCLKYSGKLKASQATIPLWVDIQKLNTFNLLPNISDVAKSGMEFLKK